MPGTPTSPARRRIGAALTLPLLAALGAPAHAALSVAPNGLGQVLVFPYYTVNGDNSTLVSVVNTTDRAKALAVRVREARNGRLVLSFNAYLAPHDTWVAAITAAGPAGPARLSTNDRSCTVPTIPAGGVPFVDFDYTLANRDHPESAAATLGRVERTREGYLEVFEVGELTAGAAPAQLAEEVAPDGAGVPVNCAAVTAAWVPGPGTGVWAANPATGIDLPTGGLRGTAAIIDVADGTMYSYAATAIAGFYTDSLAPGALHASPNAARPQLSDARSSTGLTEVVVADETGALRTEQFAGTAPNPDPVSLALMASRINGEFVADPALGADTEWVLTFPTKNASVNGAQPRPPFTTVFPATGAAPEPLALAAYDRNARAYGSGVGDCAAGTGCPQPTLRNSANVLSIMPEPAASFGGDPIVPTPILGATRGETATRLVLPRAGVGAGLQSFGQIDLAFGDRATTSPADPTGSANVLVAPSGRRYYGLPVIGVAFTRYANGALPGGVLSNYGAESRLGASLVTRP